MEALKTAVRRYHALLHLFKYLTGILQFVDFVVDDVVIDFRIGSINAPVASLVLPGVYAAARGAEGTCRITVALMPKGLPLYIISIRQ